MADSTEESDVSLLIVNDNDETAGGSSENDANLRVPDTVFTDGTASNPSLEVGTEVTCPTSVATSSMPLPADTSADVSGNATQEAVVATRNDVSCQRHRRRSHHHRSRSVVYAHWTLVNSVLNHIYC